MSDEMGDDKTVNAWCTKYDLTTGIEYRRVEVRGAYAYAPERYSTNQYAKGEWHTDRAAAVAAANAMRLRKIESLKRQIAKLEAMTF